MILYEFLWIVFEVWSPFRSYVRLFFCLVVQHPAALVEPQGTKRLDAKVPKADIRVSSFVD